MTEITLAKAMDLQAEFEALGPPPQVRRACAAVVTLAAAGGRVPHDLIQYVESWLAKRGAQNRYGQ
jgi:hypothetical protein